MQILAQTNTDGVLLETLEGFALQLCYPAAIRLAFTREGWPEWTCPHGHTVSGASGSAVGVSDGVGSYLYCAAADLQPLLRDLLADRPLRTDQLVQS